MKKIIFGVILGLALVSRSVFASGPYNTQEYIDEQNQYKSFLVILNTLSVQVTNLRNQNRITVEQEQGFMAIILNLMNTVISRISSNPVDNSAKLDISPFIKSIDKSSGPIGTVVTLKGVDLAGFEGDLDAWIENSNGEVAYLGSYGKSVYPNTNQITVQIPERACKQNNSYSGNPCRSDLNITPGIYKLYTNPWGKKSNTVSFEVTKVVATSRAYLDLSSGYVYRFNDTSKDWEVTNLGNNTLKFGISSEYYIVAKAIDLTKYYSEANTMTDNEATVYTYDVAEDKIYTNIYQGSLSDEKPSYKGYNLNPIFWINKDSLRVFPGRNRYNSFIVVPYNITNSSGNKIIGATKALSVYSGGGVSLDQVKSFVKSISFGQ